MNRTFVRRGTTVEVVSGRALLAEGDSIRILGKLMEAGDPFASAIRQARSLPGKYSLYAHLGRGISSHGDRSQSFDLGTM